MALIDEYKAGLKKAQQNLQKALKSKDKKVNIDFLRHRIKEFKKQIADEQMKKHTDTKSHNINVSIGKAEENIWSIPNSIRRGKEALRTLKEAAETYKKYQAVYIEADKLTNGLGYLVLTGTQGNKIFYVLSCIKFNSKKPTYSKPRLNPVRATGNFNLKEFDKLDTYKSIQKFNRMIKGTI